MPGSSFCDDHGPAYGRDMFMPQVRENRLGQGKPQGKVRVRDHSLTSSQPPPPSSGPLHHSHGGLINKEVGHLDFGRATLAQRKGKVRVFYKWGVQ